MRDTVYNFYIFFLIYVNLVYIYFCGYQEDEVVKRKVYSYLSGAEPDHMIFAGSSRQFQGFFKNIRVFVLNYCISREGGNAALVYTNQPTLAPEFETYNFRNESEILECHKYASYQCRADWMNQPTWEEWSPPIVSILFH